MDAIRKIEVALAALPANADSPWTNLDKMPYIHKTDDKNASPWSCAVVGRFDYLPTMDYMLACQPSAIREVLQTLASKEAELSNAALNYVSLFGELQNAQEEIARLREVLQDIADDTNPDNENSYRADDPEGCLDATHANAIAAIKQPTE